jgi:hypothetical protein
MTTQSISITKSDIDDLINQNRLFYQNKKESLKKAIANLVNIDGIVSFDDLTIEQKRKLAIEALQAEIIDPSEFFFETFNIIGKLQDINYAAKSASHLSEDMFDALINYKSFVLFVSEMIEDEISFFESNSEFCSFSRESFLNEQRFLRI